MKREETVGFTVKTLHNLIMRNEMASMEKMGIDSFSFMHAWVLGYLHENQDKEIYQKDLEAEFFIARSTVTSIVKQMEKRGYIARIGVERDSRLKCLTLLEKGEACYETFKNNFQDLEKEICQGVDRRDLDIFLKVAGQIRSNLSKNVNVNDCCMCKKSGDNR